MDKAAVGAFSVQISSSYNCSHVSAVNTEVKFWKQYFYYFFLLIPLPPPGRNLTTNLK